MVRRRSRLLRHTERTTKKNFILSLLGIAIVIFVAIKFGIPLLINFSLFIADRGSGSDVQVTNSKDPSFISPPVLDPLPIATNSAKVFLSGVGSPNQTVKIYINNSLSSQLPTKDDGSFLLVADIRKGLNTIRAKMVVKGKESGFSESITITYIDSKPTLELSSPLDGQAFSKDQNTALVSGNTSTGARITVNGFWAIVDDQGNFSYSLPLNSGENQIKVVATDEAGNTTEKEVKVTYNP